MRRTPHGTVAKDEQALREWGSFIDELEAAINVRVYAFDPRVSFVALDDAGQEIRGGSVQIPVWLAKRILQIKANKQL